MSSTLAIVVYLQARAYEIKDRGGASDKTGMGAFFGWSGESIR
jgi:hypothetical protein